MGYGKDIAKSDLITGIKSVHKFETKGQPEDVNPNKEKLQIGLAHHWGDARCEPPRGAAAAGYAPSRRRNAALLSLAALGSACRLGAV